MGSAVPRVLESSAFWPRSRRGWPMSHEVLASTAGRSGHARGSGSEKHGPDTEDQHSRRTLRSERGSAREFTDTRRLTWAFVSPCNWEVIQVNGAHVPLTCPEQPSPAINDQHPPAPGPRSGEPGAGDDLRTRTENPLVMRSSVWPRSAGVRDPPALPRREALGTSTLASGQRDDGNGVVHGIRAEAVRRGPGFRHGLPGAYASGCSPRRSWSAVAPLTVAGRGTAHSPSTMSLAARLRW